jgi:hypothetical protein
MRRVASWREEPWWHWDWPGRPQGYVQQGNGISNLGGPEGVNQTSYTYLYVPDPSAPSGWKQEFIWPDLPPPPPVKPDMGFKR